MNASVLRLLLRPEKGNAATLIIPASAFAIVTALVLTVIGGAQSFWRWDDEFAMIYQTLAGVALVLLVVPLSSLAALLVFPLVGAALVFAPLSLLTIIAVVAAGIGLVWLSTRATRPLLARAFAPAV